jgi:hypothetical protein
MIARLAVPFSLCSLWFMIAWAIDKFWFTVLCSRCSELFAFEFSLKARELLTVQTDRVSAVFLFVVPFVIYAFLLIPSLLSGKLSLHSYNYLISNVL